MASEWLEQGKRVLVSDSLQAEQFHECCLLPWNANLHGAWQGKVGVITRVGDTGDSATVRFFEFNQPQQSNQGKRLVAVDIVFHAKILTPLQQLHFLSGDRPILHHIIKEDQEINHVTLRVTGEEDGEQVFSVKAMRNQTFSWKQSDRPKEVLVPVYVGKNKQFIMRERSGGPGVATDCSAARVVWGELKGTPGSEMITSIANWSQNNGAHFRMAAQRFSHQINAVVNGRTPLMVAVEEGVWPAVVSLISLSAVREVVDPMGNTLLHLAAAKGNVRILEGLLGFLERDMNKLNADGDTPLHIAARGMHAACVDRLLCVPLVHTNIANTQGETVLHVVCRTSEATSTATTTILSRILSNPRINFNVANGSGLTVLHVAILNGNARCVELITMSRPALLVNSVPDPLVFAAQHGKNKVVDTLLLVRNEMSVDFTPSPDGRTALHAAVESWAGDVDSDLARLACIQSLSTAGVPTSGVNSLGQTPCHLLVRYLNENPKHLDRNVLLNAVTTQRASTKLDEVAAKLKPHWQLAALCFLVARGCDLTIMDKEGRTAIDWCQDGKIKDTLKMLAADRLRCCLPMGAPRNDFDTSNVHMCTFNCEDSVADVQFVPCGHRVMCKECATQTPLRRCPVCYTNIASAIDAQGNAVEMGSALRAPAQPVAPPVTVSYDSAVQRIASEVAQKAKKDADNDKKKEIEELKGKLLKLEMETSCAICMDARPSVVFSCGHTSCGECAEALTLCHICRQPIEQKRVIYT